jgi:hypothetical protein
MDGEIGLHAGSCACRCADVLPAAAARDDTLRFAPWRRAIRW